MASFFVFCWFSLNYYLRSIGVSNFAVDDLRKLLKIAHVKPAVNQVSLFITDHYDLNPIMSGYDRFDCTHIIMPKMHLF